jgi:TPP-dependent pyruvate/acetoin dehydrogenase alpha subunit
MAALYAEMMGKPDGISGGRGGSQHIHWRDFYSNGILGSTIPIATGTALAEKQKGSGAITVAFLGDGALGEGVVYEALNMAVLWGAPILYVLENNHIAQTTPTGLGVAGSMTARFEAFGITTAELDSSDVCEIAPLARELIGQVRASREPRALVIHTQRFGPHSKGDDTRDAESVAHLRATRDPLRLHEGRVPPEAKAEIDAAAAVEVRDAFAKAQAAAIWEAA